MVKKQVISTVTDADNYFDYDWKIGLSILDIGFNQYKYGNKSGTFPSPVANVTGGLVDQKLDSASNFSNFNDSLASLASGYSIIDGKFKVQNPTRIIVNIDRALENHFYLNGELSLNLHASMIGAQVFHPRTKPSNHNAKI